ncbi:MAG TPA: hypothetical protein DDW52_09270 [Planctomycetaceae bacterium]|nr:hypothetical protein [Planctomycetaceae bacterium]
MVVRLFLLLGLLQLLSGCANLLKSRYAMDDPVYAAKYTDGASKTQPLKKLKQAIDARHVEGLGGGYFTAGTQWRDSTQGTLAGAEIGSEAYPTSWLSYRMAMAGYIGPDDWYAGGDVGARLQLPTRLTPFVGVGTFHGLSLTREEAEDDRIDNDDNGFIDERGEMATTVDGWLSTIYPETGVHFWLSGQSRLTGYARYIVSSHGRDADDWLAGIQFSAFSR